MVLTGKLTFATTRHHLFLLPFIVYLSISGLHYIAYSAKFSRLRYLYQASVAFVAFLYLLLLASSSFSLFQRFDPLKINSLPSEITEFVASSASENVITLLDCDRQYLYNDFRDTRAGYSKIIESKNLPLTTPGKRLIVFSRDTWDFILSKKPEELSKGDVLLTKYADIQIKLMAKPFSVGKNVYYDSYNYDSRLRSFDLHPYSRPNKVTILPVEITKRSS